MTRPSEARKIAHKLSKEISSHYIGRNDGSCEMEDWIEEALLAIGEKRFEEGVRKSADSVMKTSWVEGEGYYEGRSRFRDAVLSLLPKDN